MSEWYKAEKDDIDLDTNCNEVNIYVTHNDCGYVYVTLTFEQIKNIYNSLPGAVEELSDRIGDAFVDGLDA